MADPVMLKGWFVVGGAAVAGAALLVTAGIHRLGQGSPEYARSPLIGIEIGLVIVLALVLLAQPIMAIVYLAKKQWRGLAVVAAATAVSLICWVAAMILDGATLLHAT